MSSRYHPMSGEGARAVGGRWNPPDSFPTLYLASSLETAVAEVERGFAAQGRSLDEAIDLVAYPFEVELAATLDLVTSDEALAAVGLSPADVRSPDRRKCQEVGEAAHFVGLEAIRARSGVGTGEVVAVFLDKQGPNSSIIHESPIDWR
jgi:RES domain-containing protein